MPKIYDKLGMRFQYPDNWTLDEGEAASGIPSVTVYSPGGSFWSVARHERAADPKRLAKTALQAMRDEYQDLESEAVCESIAGHRLVGYDINFCYLDLTSTATVRCATMPEGVYVVFCEAEDREFDDLRSVFAAITHSLLTRR
jgi:hypothetical protein